MGLIYCDFVDKTRFTNVQIICHFVDAFNPQREIISVMCDCRFNVLSLSENSMHFVVNEDINITLFFFFWLSVSSEKT